MIDKNTAILSGRGEQLLHCQPPLLHPLGLIKIEASVEVDLREILSTLICIKNSNRNHLKHCLFPERVAIVEKYAQMIARNQHPF